MKRFWFSMQVAGLILGVIATVLMNVVILVGTVRIFCVF